MILSITRIKDGLHGYWFKMIGSFFVIIVLLLISTSGYAKTEYRATASFENTNFLIHRGRHSINDYETFRADFEFTYDNEKSFKVLFHPRVRVDFLDFSRNRYLPRETYLMFYTPHIEVSGGLQLKHWGVSNFFNPTDILNRSDFEDNFYEPEKLGELMLGFKGTIDELGPFTEFTVEAIALPFFQKSPLPQLDTRFAVRGQANGIPYTLFDHQETQNYPQAIGGALKVSATINPVDLALHFYHGPEKSPGYFLRIDNTGALRLGAFYYLIDMIGFNLEAPVGNFVLHLETAYKITAINEPRRHDIVFEDNNAVPQSYFQFVPGLDYTFHHFAGDGDITFIFEYIGETNHETNLRNFRPFRNDLFFGFRYEFLNRLQSQIEFGVVKDLSNGEAAILVDISSKIYKELKLSVGGVFIHRDGNHPYSPLSFFDNNSYVTARLSYSFGGKL